MPDRLGRSCIFCERNQRSSLANYGACIQCAWKNCRLHFHVSCAGAEGLLSELPAGEANASLSIAEILFGTIDKNNTLSDFTEISKDINQSCEKESHKYQLNGFCCSQHMKKFMSETSNSTSVPGIAHGNSDINKSHKSPTSESSCEVNIQPPRRRSSQSRLSQRSLNSDSNRTDESSNSHDDFKSDGKATTLECKSEFNNHQNSYTIQKDHLSNESHSSEFTTTDCSNAKRIKMDANLNKDEISEAINTERVLTSPSSSSSSSSLSSSTTTITAITTNNNNNSSTVTSTITLSQNSTIPVIATQENLPLILPRRPLSLRGLGITCNSKNSSILNNIAGMYVDSPSSVQPTNKITVSTKSDHSILPPPPPPPPTLATMHDLLEWQWDQAGALLMQQAKNTDVVTLLDCLHQLKCENDILEAKLIRLTTRHEHLKSVNARLSDSLATMESTMVINSPKHEIPEQNSTKITPNLTKKLSTNHHCAYPLDTITSNNTITTQNSHLSTILHSIDQESHQLQLSDNTTKSHSQQSMPLYNNNSNNNHNNPSVAKYSTIENKKIPILSKDITNNNNTTTTAGSTICSNLNSIDKNCLNHHHTTQPVISSASSSSSTSLDCLKLSNETMHTTNFSNLIKHQTNTFINDSLTIHTNNQIKTTLDYLSNSCSSASSLPSTNSTYFTKGVDLNDLQELSARLSSAIAARQPQSNRTINSTMSSCPPPILSKHSGHHNKRNNKTLNSNQSSSSSKLPIPPLTTTTTTTTSSSLINGIAKLDTLTSYQNFCSTTMINNLQSVTLTNNVIATTTTTITSAAAAASLGLSSSVAASAAYSNDHQSVMTQSQNNNPLSFMIFAPPTISDLPSSNHTTLASSSTNPTIITTNKLISNELTHFDTSSSMIVTTNSNSIGLSK
ncbi:unnamed protein product [Schistosoma turkestanicum]|nr:unnamed protein product [Schistosoma turkestanicum]